MNRPSGDGMGSPAVQSKTRRRSPSAHENLASMRVPSTCRKTMLATSSATKRNVSAPPPTVIATSVGVRELVLLQDTRIRILAAIDRRRRPEAADAGDVLS